MEVREWAASNGWWSRFEVPVAIPDAAEKLSRGRGLYDVVVERPAMRDLAIEIDRTNKRWSAEKLGIAVAQGMDAVWIRWSGEPPAPDLVPDGVVVVKISVRAVRQTSEFPRGWISRGRRMRN